MFPGTLLTSGKNRVLWLQRAWAVRKRDPRKWHPERWTLLKSTSALYFPLNKHPPISWACLVCWDPPTKVYWNKQQWQDKACNDFWAGCHTSFPYDSCWWQPSHWKIVQSLPNQHSNEHGQTGGNQLNGFTKNCSEARGGLIKWWQKETDAHQNSCGKKRKKQ